MKPTLTPARTPAEVQIDVIANGLPESVRADFHREMKYCSSLSQNDEMLHILNIIRILAVVMVDVPLSVANERRKLEDVVRAVMEQMQENLAASKAYHKQIDDRLSQLPAEIAKGISPSTVAASINESLRQQFVKSTIPETATALALIAAKLRIVTSDFEARASALGDSYSGAVAAAKKATKELDSAISGAAKSAEHANKVLATTYGHSYRWAFYVFSAIGVFVGSVLMVLLFMMFFGHKDPPPLEPRTTMGKPVEDIRSLEELLQPKRGSDHAHNSGNVRR